MMLSAEPEQWMMITNLYMMVDISGKFQLENWSFDHDSTLMPAYLLRQAVVYTHMWYAVYSGLN